MLKGQLPRVIYHQAHLCTKRRTWIHLSAVRIFNQVINQGPTTGRQVHGPVDPPFRALSGRLEFTVRRHKFNKDSHKFMVETEAWPGQASRSIRDRRILKLRATQFGTVLKPRTKLLLRNVKRLRGGLTCKARILVCQSTLGSRVIQKKKSRSTRDQGIGPSVYGSGLGVRVQGLNLGLAC